MKRTIVVFWVAFFTLIAAEANAAVYTFEWTATVEVIVDGFDEPATLEGVNVGDWFVATITYDTADFGPGEDVPAGMVYPAPAGLQIMYQFESGGVFSENITYVDARKSVPPGRGYCQWNWMGDDYGGILFQANDLTYEAFDLPLPYSFDDMHTLFLSTLSLFEPSTGNIMYIRTGDPYTERGVWLTEQAFSVTLATPTPVVEILSFFDEVADNGTLVGTGPGSSAPHRMNALRNMIETAGELIDGGLYDEACQQLNDAHARCDGLGVPGSPPDFVTGPAASELATLILDLIMDLGCP